MSDIGKNALKTKIDNKVYENSSQAITGTIMNEVLQDMVDTLADGGNLDEASVDTANLKDEAVTKGKLEQNVSADLDWAVASNSYYRNSQAGNVAAKAITTYKNMNLRGGGSLKVTFEQANTADDATLNIDGNGAKPLYYNGARVSSTNSWEAGETVEIYYNNYTTGIYYAKRWMVEPVSVSQNTETGDDSLLAGSSVLGKFADAGKLIKLKGFFDSLAAADASVSEVGQYFYFKGNNKIYRCLAKPMGYWTDAEEVPFYDGAIYLYDNALYIYDNGLKGIKLRGSYSNEDDVKERGVYAQEDRGEGFAYGFLIVQKADNTIVQFRLAIGVSVLQPSIQYRLSTDNGTTWGSWIDWVEQSYSPYTPKTRTIYKFLKALGDTPNGGYYYNVNTLKVYQNNGGFAVEVTPREQDRYEFEGKQYIYSASGLTPLENAILEISGYDDTSSQKATNGTYYVVGRNLIYVVEAGVNSVLIPWEKGRPYLYKGSLYFYNGNRLIRADNTGVTQANPPSAKCISDSFIGKASCASRIAINANGIAYVAYMCGSNSWYEANEKVVLSEFPINRPEMAKNYVVANYTDDGINGKLALPNVHLLPNGNVRVLFSNYQTSEELMTIFYKDFDVSTKEFGTLNRITYNGSPFTFNTLETIVGTSLETSDGIHISGNLMNDFGVDGNDNPIKYFFINAADKNPVVFSTIDDFESVQLVKVLPITDREYESALCKLGNTFYIYYRASSGSWLTTTTDWETFTPAVQFSTLNNRADIYCDGTKVYLCGANAETTDINVFRRTNAHILVGTGATLDGYTEVQEIYDERGLVELNYIYIGNTHIIVCSSSPIMIDAQTYSVRYRGKYGIYFITIRDATPSGLIR